MRYLLALVVLCVALVQSASAEWKIVKLIEAPSVRSFDVNRDGSLVAYNTPAMRDIFKEGKLANLDQSAVGAYLYDVKKERKIPLTDSKLPFFWGVVFSSVNNQLVTMGTGIGYWADNGRLQRSTGSPGAVGSIIRSKRGAHFLELNGANPTLWSFSGSFKTSFTGGRAQYVSLSTDGKHIVTVGRQVFTSNNTKDNQRVNVGPLEFCRWSAGGKLEHNADVTRVTDKNKEHGYFDDPAGEIIHAIGIACSEDGEEVVIACIGGSLVTITGTGVPKLLPGDFVEALSIQNHSVAMSDDGKTIAVGRTVNLASSGTAGTAPNQEIALWQDRIPKVLTGHTSTVTKVMFLNDTTLVSADEGGVIGIWDLKSEETKVEFITGKGPAEDIKISGDNRTIAVLQKGNGILVLKTDAKKEPPVLKPKKATKKEVAGGKR